MHESATYQIEYLPASGALRRRHERLEVCAGSGPIRLRHTILARSEAVACAAGVVDRAAGYRLEHRFLQLCAGRAATLLATTSFTRGYSAELLPTMFAADSVIEARYDELARMLAVEKPPGTVIQFRLSSGPDPGRAIAAHLRARGSGELTHPEASRLHAMNIDYYRAAVEAGAYRHGLLSVWVRVPVRARGDATSNGLSAFIPAVGREIKRHGISHIAQALRTSYASTLSE